MWLNNVALVKNAMAVEMLAEIKKNIYYLVLHRKLYRQFQTFALEKKIMWLSS